MRLLVLQKRDLQIRPLDLIFSPSPAFDYAVKRSEVRIFAGLDASFSVLFSSSGTHDIDRVHNHPPSSSPPFHIHLHFGQKLSWRHADAECCKSNRLLVTLTWLIICKNTRLFTVFFIFYQVYLHKSIICFYANRASHIGSSENTGDKMVV